MITPIAGIPANMVAFKATGAVTKDDFDNVVVPAVEALVNQTGELNYLFWVDTPLHNFTTGAWWRDAMMGLQKIRKWKRAAVVSDSEGINTFTNLFGYVVPGEFKGFKPRELDEAIAWVATGKK
ncbi:MAG: STAS/SEC14 domain-containing protein [Chitinophagaceae bacterium]|nr:MAG: STAS/SEC14 domain-containing protein [Chitinophagaceae bacterium]